MVFGRGPGKDGWTDSGASGSNAAGGSFNVSARDVAVYGIFKCLDSNSSDSDFATTGTNFPPSASCRQWSFILLPSDPLLPESFL